MCVWKETFGPHWIDSQQTLHGVPLRRGDTIVARSSPILLYILRGAYIRRVICLKSGCW